MERLRGLIPKSVLNKTVTPKPIVEEFKSDEPEYANQEIKPITENPAVNEGGLKSFYTQMINDSKTVLKKNPSEPSPIKEGLLSVGDSIRSGITAVKNKKDGLVQTSLTGDVDEVFEEKKELFLKGIKDNKKAFENVVDKYTNPDALSKGGKVVKNGVKGLFNSINTSMPYKLVFLFLFVFVFYKVIYRICVFFGIDIVILNMYLGWVSFLLVVFTFLPHEYGNILDTPE